jgi:hypothetical protein
MSRRFDPARDQFSMIACRGQSAMVLASPFEGFPASMLRTILITLLGPMLWGTTYAVFTETLPVSHPLLVGALGHCRPG